MTIPTATRRMKQGQSTEKSGRYGDNAVRRAPAKSKHRGGFRTYVSKAKRRDTTIESAIKKNEIGTELTAEERRLIKERLEKLMRAVEDLPQTGQTVKEATKETGIPYANVPAILELILNKRRAVKKDLRADDWGMSGDEIVYFHVFEDPDVSLPADAKKTIRSVCAEALTEKETYIVRKRCYEGETYQKIADVLHVSRQAVQQAEQRAYRKMRAPGRKQVLYDGLQKTQQREAAEQALIKKYFEKHQKEQLAKEVPDRIRDMEVRQMHLSVRSTNALEKAGLLTAGEISAAGKEKVLHINNIGQKCFLEITDIMAKLGLPF